MALFQFFRRMIFGTDLSPKKIILKGADLLDPYLTQFQFRVELENALMSLYAHPQQVEDLRTAMSVAEAPVPAVHSYLQASLRKSETTQQSKDAQEAMENLMGSLEKLDEEMANGIRSAWESMLTKMSSEDSRNVSITGWIADSNKLLRTH